MKRVGDVVLFYSSKDIFSNFYPCNIRAFGQDFASSEQFFMYMKALIFNDVDMGSRILDADTPAKAKALGRQVKGYNDSMWQFVRVSIMFLANYYKFTQNISLRNQLLETGDHLLAEASPTDDVWGIGLAEDDETAGDRSNWRGANLLGRVLMRVRTAIINGEVNKT